MSIMDSCGNRIEAMEGVHKEAIRHFNEFLGGLHRANIFVLSCLPLL